MQEIIPYQNPNVPKEQGLSLKEKLLYSAIGLAVLGGGVYFGRKLILNKVADKEESQSFEDGSSATTAKQIKMAFENDGWFGTNTTALRNALRQISSKDEFAKVQKSYQKLYNSNLLKDMSDELQSTEYNEMLQIIAGKPPKKGQAPTVNAYDAWAKRLKAAFDKVYGFLPGTDGDAVVAVFNEIPTQTAFIQTAVSFKKLYGTNMLDDMKAEAEFGQYSDWMKIITTKKKK
ncbi:MAG: hypothetical protein JNJ41_03360 [Bacteroidia bacterium]|nr:hypothetical protein [Bacteroidia bacterium]